MLRLPGPFGTLGIIETLAGGAHGTALCDATVVAMLATVLVLKPDSRGQAMSVASHFEID